MVVAFALAGVVAGAIMPIRFVRAAKVNFSRDVLPILSDKCFKCHGPDAASRMAGLRLDTSSGAFANRQGKFAIVPGKPEHSMLVQRIHDKRSPMPPEDSGKKLTDGERLILTRWIEQGATYAKLWSFEPLPAKVVAPKVSGTWPRDDIDRFIYARLAREKLSPSPAANRDRWLRRVTYDLIGLPPTEAEAAAFAADDSPKAFEKVVNRLLSNPHFGERVAVDWLDAARYSDSYGYQSDLLMPTWPYRDWVVRAFNENLPYDRFLTYQIAGDLLPSATTDQRLATAFNRLHRQSNEGGSIALEFKTEYAADRVNTFGTAVLGLTLGCARCHDHKFDPISQREYYQLFGYFNSIDEYGLLLSTEIVPTPSLLLPTDEQKAKLAALQKKNEAAVFRWKEAVKNCEPRFASWLASQKSGPTIPDLVAKISMAKEAAGKFQVEGSNSVVVAKIGSPKTVTGRAGPALEFSGDDGMVVRGLSAKQRSEPFTWSFWIRDSRPTAAPVVLLHRTGGTDVGFCGFDLTLENGYLTARVMRHWPGNAVAIRSKIPVPKDTWSHIAWSWDGSGRAAGLRLYIDGRPLASTVLNDRLWKKINAYGDLGPSGSEWSFAQRFRDSGFKGGRLSEVTFAARSLSELEVRHLFDGHSLTDAIANPNVNLSGLREYFSSAIDDECRKSSAAIRDAQSALTIEEEPVREISVMEDASRVIPSFLLARGAYDAPRTEANRVARGVPEALPALRSSGTNNRLALANWTTRADNPLTARVAVNRFWQMMFGTGLVETSENFGVQGTPPSHRELLDYLARYFIDSGWNVKALLRKIALSATYRQESVRTTKLAKVDPDNRLLARGPSHRLSAEMVRDTALAAAGLLNPAVGGPPVNPYQPAGIWQENNTMSPGFVQSKGPDLYRRSLYSTWKRTTPVPSMVLFDATSREACAIRRPTTNTPLQALVLLNDVQFVEASRVLAEKALASQTILKLQCRSIFRRLTGRSPDAREETILVKTFDEQLVDFTKDPSAAAKLISIGDSKPTKQLDPTRLAALTVVAQTVLNSDSVVWRR